jgi:hypothetical protein
VLRKIILELHIELDKAIHGYGHGRSLESHDPNMTKCWAERGLAVSIEKLSDHSHEGEENADEAVLIHANIDNLSSTKSVLTN